MLAALERATWLSSYCSAQECLFREYFVDNGKYSALNKAFIEDLVHLYSATLTFLIQAHEYYAKGTIGDSFFYKMGDSSHTFTARLAGAISPSNWVTDLTKAIEDRKLRMEEYASLVHKSSEHLLTTFVA